jgi:hypothetical protein
VGTRTAIVAYGEEDVPHVLRGAPVLDRSATATLVRKVFPTAQIEAAKDALLFDSLGPPDGVAYVGCFPDLDLVCSWLLVSDRPSEAAKRCPPPPDRPNMYLHAMDSATNWCAFAMWCGGDLVRSLSVSPERTYEDVGDPLPFEEPFRERERPVDPLGLAGQALYTFFGFQLDGMANVNDVDPEVIPLVGYRIR